MNGRRLLAICAAVSVLLIFISATEAAQSHATVWGARTSNDVHLWRQEFKKKSKVLRTVKEDYRFDQTAAKYGSPRTITQIVVTDHQADGDDATATLKSGGPGLDFAVITFKSERGHGYMFTVDIFGQ